jgi:transcriptional regulator of acetoin/glycerol metabolism
MMHPVMAISERFAGSWDAAARHAEQVYSVAAGAKPPPGVENVSRSWERSANRHRVDSGDSRAPNILTFGELKNFREPLDELIFSAQEEIN